MKKRGFTLVELLAVIAILAILVIIALPNVMGMFNTAKKNSFTTEVKELYKIAQQQWISDSMFNTTDQEYGRCSGCSYKELDLTGRQELKYYIKIDKSGNVVKYYATDGTYQFRYDGSGLLVTDITDVDQVTELNDDQVITIDDNYGSARRMTIFYVGQYNLAIGSSFPSGLDFYNTYQEATNAFGENFFTKLVLNDGVIEEAYVGLKYNGNVTYFRGGNSSYYANNKITAQNLWGASFCNEYNSGSSTLYQCHKDDLYINIHSEGNVSINNEIHSCDFYNYLFCGDAAA